MAISKTLLAMVGLAIAAVPVLGQNAQFGSEPLGRVDDRSSDRLLGLADVMLSKQWRHIKLWYAAKANNWILVKYEADAIESSLARAAMHYVNIPVVDVLAAAKPLAEIRSAASARDGARFDRGFEGLTLACNSCHSAGKVGFIKIQKPTASPFSDQAFQ